MMMYLLLANLYLGVFYLFYHVLLRRETFFNWNRAYLLCAIMLSFTLPMVKISGISLSAGMEQQSFFQFTEETGNAMIVNTGEAVFAAQEPTLLDRAKKYVPDLYSIYLAGCLLSIFLFIFRMRAVYYLIIDKKHQGAFSFFRFIRVDKKTKGGELIHLHEEVHAREWHSLDIMLMQLVKIFNWFNPAVYLMERSLKLQHEYRADSQVAWQDQTQYAELLLTTALRVPGENLTNQFINPTLLKSRIMMLLKTKTPKQNRAKFALVLPIIAAMSLFSAACNQADKNNKENTDEALETTPMVTETQDKPAADTLELNMPPAIEPPPPIRVVPADSAKRKDQVRMPEMTVTPAAPRKKDQVRPPDMTFSFDKVEIQPVPPQGSADEFRKWFLQTFKTPQIALDAEFSGRIDVTFIVEPNGELSSFVNVFQGEQDREVSNALSQALQDVLRSCPDWKPGIQDGKPARVSYTLPVRLHGKK